MTMRDSLARAGTSRRALLAIALSFAAGSFAGWLLVTVFA